jgi:hypothetical protein
MTARWGWFTQPARATSANLSGYESGCTAPGYQSRRPDVCRRIRKCCRSNRPFTLGVDRVFGHYAIGRR